MMRDKKIALKNKTGVVSCNKKKTRIATSIKAKLRLRRKDKRTINLEECYNLISRIIICKPE